MTRFLTIAVTCVIACAFSACAESETTVGTAPDNEPAPPTSAVANPESAKRAPRRNQTGTAAAMLKKIRTRNESSAAGYSRDLFGGWTTNGGCDTRESVLIAESRAGHPSGCAVVHGRWNSAYDGRTVRDPGDLDIDHMVPLAQAYVSGANRWSAGTRSRYANDLGYAGTLRAVTASTNRSKSDNDPAHWMPPRQIHRCKYIGTWIAVKYRWKLSADWSEMAVLRHYVKSCGRKSDVPKPRRASVRVSKRKRSRPRSPASKRDSDKRFSTCAKAIAHGLGPYRRGKDPEYAWYRDADKDGTVCER